ncbi:MAG TPA: S-layer homology domain-containing protein, partial [Thermoanaerobaculia bacterium]|nr:S-layer homology domain-containing protein [Thermoanaerobaculia bacterium]
MSPLFFLVAAAVLVGGSQDLLGTCGSFTDVAADVFCPFVLEIFTLGITTGTTATTYDPTGNVTRLQMAAFLSRTVDGVVNRASRRAALGQFWTPQNDSVLSISSTRLARFSRRSPSAHSPSSRPSTAPTSGCRT